MAEPDLTFDKAFELAVVSESADKNAKDLQATKFPQASVNRVQSKQIKLCYRCGGKHKAVDCQFKSTECHKCSKKGHLACICRSKTTSKKDPRPQQDSTTSRATHTLIENTDDYSMYYLTGPPVKPLVVSVKVNNKDLEMELDTGASVSIISEVTYNHLWLQGQTPTLQESQVKLKMYSGKQVAVKDMVHVKVQYKEQTERLHVVGGCLWKRTKFVWQRLAYKT